MAQTREEFIVRHRFVAAVYRDFVAAPRLQVGIEQRTCVVSLRQFEHVAEPFLSTARNALASQQLEAIERVYRNAPVR
jgi:hypothetical protein